jgi:stress response protein YsnF
MTEDPSERIGGAPEPIVIPVIHEEASVHKRIVDTGRGVRIHKTVIERPFAIDERLLRDAVEVTRVPIDRIVMPDQAPGIRYEGDTLVMPIVEEVLVVERRLRIKEELRVTTTRHEERHTDTVMLKAEAVSVERFDESRDGPAP